MGTLVLKAPQILYSVYAAGPNGAGEWLVEQKVFNRSEPQQHV